VIWKALLALALCAWLALFFTGSGVLIHGERQRLPDDRQDSLACRYFIGTSVVERTFWYSPNGLMGRAICPRLIRF
jgi:hypothetical protein